MIEVWSKVKGCVSAEDVEEISTSGVRRSWSSDDVERMKEAEMKMGKPIYLKRGRVK